MSDRTDPPRWALDPTADHEQVAFCFDRASGLRAIIALHSTELGPGLGGTRFHPYESTEAALADVLKLSRSMTYKNALAGLDHGGGKAVIIGDPATEKTEARLRAYGRFVQALGGRYVTACDVGTYVEDMDVVARECDFVTGRSEANGGAGDSSVLTAFGVFQGMRAAATHLWGGPSLHGRRVGIAGVGKVGRHLVDLLLEDGAVPIVCDVNPSAVEGVRTRHPEVKSVAALDELISSDIDVYAPCALGGALDDSTVEQLKASIVCGGANNQLAHPGVQDALAARGVLYCPDYLVNAGGVIQVADELDGFSFERAKAKAAGLYDATLAVLTEAAERGVTPAAAADDRAERRIAEVGNRRPWLPPRRD